MNKVFSMSVGSLSFKNERIPKNLINGGVATIGDLVKTHPWQIFTRDWRQLKKNTVKSLGARSLREIEEELGRLGLKLSMTQAEMEEYKGREEK